jgi:hypothetical protein
MFMAHERRTFDVQLEILKEELAHIDGAIRQDDEITKSVKNWAIVTWTASVGLALKDPSLHKFMWLTAVVPIVFWIVDGSFRRIQRSFISRVQQISEFVNSNDFKVAAENGEPMDFPLLLMRRKTREFNNTQLGTMLFGSVSILYIGLAPSVIMFPTYAKSGDTHLGALAPLQTMTRLLETNTDLHRPATEATLAEFLQFVEHTPAYELVYKDLPSAKALIEAWLDHMA